jgi:hypothetical protein
VQIPTFFLPVICCLLCDWQRSCIYIHQLQMEFGFYPPCCDWQSSIQSSINQPVISATQAAVSLVPGANNAAVFHPRGLLEPAPAASPILFAFP